jgi:hypothetical protein
LSGASVNNKKFAAFSTPEEFNFAESLNAPSVSALKLFFFFVDDSRDK